MPLKRIDIVFTTRNEINQNCSFTFFHMDIKKILMVFGGRVFEFTFIVFCTHSSYILIHQTISAHKNLMIL